MTRDEDLIEAMVTAAEDWLHADRFIFDVVDAYERERIARYLAPRMLAAARAVSAEIPPLTGGMHDGPLVELYRMWTDHDGREHIAVYMPQPDGSTALRHYVEATS